jgi:hypothetical protein
MSGGNVRAKDRAGLGNRFWGVWNFGVWNFSGSVAVFDRVTPQSFLKKGNEHIYIIHPQPPKSNKQQHFFLAGDRALDNERAKSAEQSTTKKKKKKKKKKNCES